jgi:hypothetical protein
MFFSARVLLLLLHRQHVVGKKSKTVNRVDSVIAAADEVSQVWVGGMQLSYRL